MYGMAWYGMVWYGMVWYVCMYPVVSSLAPVDSRRQLSRAVQRKRQCWCVAEVYVSLFLYIYIYTYIHTHVYIYIYILYIFIFYACIICQGPRHHGHAAGCGSRARRPPIGTDAGMNKDNIYISLSLYIYIYIYIYEYGHICIYIYILFCFLFSYIHIYIYIHIEREIERETYMYIYTYVYMYVCMYVCVYIYIYIYIYILCFRTAKFRARDCPCYNVWSESETSGGLVILQIRKVKKSAVKHCSDKRPEIRWTLHDNTWHDARCQRHTSADAQDAMREYSYTCSACAQALPKWQVIVTMTWKWRRVPWEQQWDMG